MEEILKSLPEPMQINETTLIVAVLFLVLMALLNSLIFKPLLAIMEERESKIRTGEEEYAKALKTVEESEAAYRDKVIGERRKAQSERQNLLKETEKAREDMVAEAREKAQVMVRKASTDLETQVGDARAALKQDSEVVAKQIAAAVLSRASA